MNYNDFITTYKNRAVVILLEGKRDVLKEDQLKLEAIAKQLATELPLATFRSGNATGADELFSKGVASVNINQLHIIKPYAAHRKNISYDAISTSLESIELAADKNLIYQTKKASQKSSNLVDKYLAGEKNALSAKASYLLRDTVKVLGAKDISPIDIALFYDDLNNPLSGGTGHTIRVCIENKVPYFNQSVWMNWVTDS